MKLSLFGASNDTGNLGVSALFFSCLIGIGNRLPKSDLTVFDNTMGRRSARVETGNGEFQYTLFGGRPSKKFYRSDSLSNIRFCSRLGGLWNFGAKSLLKSDAILDITGGDSFTDLYGPKAFRNSCLRKELALGNGIPLVLLPQTYGPFQAPESRERAGEICRKATAAWARDQRSYEYLLEILGNAFNAERHHVGVDVAFLLPSVKPGLTDEISQFLMAGNGPLVGFNVSGLIYNNPDLAVSRFGLRADYRRTVHQILAQILGHSDSRVLLVPHVVTDPDHYESDRRACQAVLDSFGPEYSDRIRVAPALDDPREIKWVISQMDWFCGTRMHATIAGLSMGVPTASISYSIKTLGVFETCGMGKHVADPKEMSTEEVAGKIFNSFTERGVSAENLRIALPVVKTTAEQQMDAIAAVVQGGR